MRPDMNMERVHQHSTNNRFHQLNVPHDSESCTFPSSELRLNSISDGKKVWSFRLPFKNRTSEVIKRDDPRAKPKHLNTGTYHSTSKKPTF